MTTSASSQAQLALLTTGEWDEITDVRSWGAAESWNVKEIVIQITAVIPLSDSAMPSASPQYTFPSVFAEAETALVLTYNGNKHEPSNNSSTIDVKYNSNSDFALITDTIKNCNSVNNSSPCRTSTVGRDLCHKAYDPFKCLSAITEQSLRGDFTHALSLSCDGDDNIDGSSTADSNKNSSTVDISKNSSTVDISKYSSYSLVTAVNNDIDFISHNQAIHCPSCDKNMYSPLSCSPSVSPHSCQLPSSSSSSYFMHTSSLRMATSNVCDSPGYQSTSTDKSNDFLRNDRSFSHSPPANHTSEGCAVATFRPDCKKSYPSYSSEQGLRESEWLLSWTSQHPEGWSSTQVLDWVFFVAQDRRVDMQEFRAENFQAYTGAQLCQMGLEDFTRLEPTFGHVIYGMFQKLLCGGLTQSSYFKQNQYSHLENRGLDTTSYDFDFNNTPCLTTSQSAESYQQGFDLFPIQYQPLTAIRSPCCFPTAHIPGHISRRRPGRQPAKCLMDDGRVIKEKKVKSQHLWEFIYETLMNPMYNPQFLRWENQRDGVFRFVQSEAVAQLWGDRKNNENMTYEKLSRAMRHYYRRGILERVEGRRLVYKFSSKAMERICDKRVPL